MDPKRFDNSGEAFADDVAELYGTPDPINVPEEEEEEQEDK